MSEFLDYFPVFRYFPQHLKKDIKLLHVFDNNITYCVTNNDEVYCIGKNVRKYLGYNESNDNNKYVLIQELCDKQIDGFFGGDKKSCEFIDSCYFFARSETNAIYSWGCNFKGQLARGYQVEGNT